MTTISVKLKDRQLKHLKRMSHQLSLERGKDLSLSDLVREALDVVYPREPGDEIPKLISITPVSEEEAKVIMEVADRRQKIDANNK